MNDLDWQGEVFCLRFFQNPLDGVIYVNIVTTCQEEDNYYFLFTKQVRDGFGCEKVPKNCYCCVFTETMRRQESDQRVD